MGVDVRVACEKCPMKLFFVKIESIRTWNIVNWVRGCIVQCAIWWAGDIQDCCFNILEAIRFKISNRPLSVTDLLELIKKLICFIRTWTRFVWGHQATNSSDVTTQLIYRRHFQIFYRIGAACLIVFFSRFNFGWLILFLNWSYSEIIKNN